MAGEEADEAPVIGLDTGAPIEGAPLACVVSRLTWPQERGSILNKKGDTITRMPDGPQSLEDVLTEANETYFDTRQASVDNAFDVVDHDSVQTD